MRGRNDVKVVKLNAGVGPKWRVIDPGHEVKVRIFDTDKRAWSGWVVFTSTTTARYIEKHFNRVEFSAPTLGPGETVRIEAIGGPFDHP